MMAVVPLMLAGLVVRGCARYGKFGVYGGRGCLLGAPPHQTPPSFAHTRSAGPQPQHTQGIEPQAARTVSAT
eukprot:SAG22_NODE_22065_length_251_cov_6.105263_1_plen_71_part_01